jgi:hypothetical protein
MSADINLDNVNVDLDLSGGADFGLDAIAGALTSGVNASVALGLDNVKADVDVGLDDIRIKELPLIRSDSKLDLGLDNIRIQELPPFRFDFSMRPIRIHLPLNYSFCVEIFGIRLFKFSVCGEGMVVTEDYHAHATERCE